MTDDVAGFRPRRFGVGCSARNGWLARLAAWLAEAAGAERAGSVFGNTAKRPDHGGTMPWWATTSMSVLAATLNDRRGHPPDETPVGAARRRHRR
jgi:hypothetical protein